MSSPLQKQSTAAAAIRLPPSPEHGSIPAMSLPPPLVENRVRFRAAAQYSTFAPQTLATTTRLFGSDTSSKRPQPCMTALAGPHGIVVFDTSQPHKARMVLRHEVQQQDGYSWTALEFQPQTTNESSLLLAGSRGTGVLIWDVGGQSLSPLLGRLGPTTRSSDFENRTVVDLSWKPSGNALATCTATGASLWDLRSSTISTNCRPSLRFGSSSIRSPANVQIAYGSGDSQDHVALMDSGGTVRIFDVRMIRNNSNGATCAFTAHAHTGVGLSWMPPCEKTDSGCWLSWGLEDHVTTTVKLWKPKSHEAPLESKVTATDSDSYWFMDGSSERSPSSPLPKAPLPEYQLAASMTVEGLACARVCPNPMKQSIVTVSSSCDHKDKVSWQAELWSISSTASPQLAVERKGTTDSLQGETKTYGLSKMASFAIDDEHDALFRTVVGKLHQGRTGVGSFLAAELALIPEKVQRASELVLCCLTENGYIVSYAIHEAEELLPNESRGSLKGTGSFPIIYKDGSPIRRALQMVRLSREGSSGVGTGSIVQLPFFRGVYQEGAPGQVATEDAASAMNNMTDGDTTWGEKMSRRMSGDEPTEIKPFASLVDGSSVTPLSPQEQQMLLDRNLSAGIIAPPLSQSKEEDPLSRIALGVEGGIMQFEMEIGGGFGSGSDEAHQVTIEVDAPTTEKIDDQSNTPDDSPPIRAQTEKVPCPRLCGAVFGSRGLVCFHNGEVRKMWSWYAEQQEPSSKRSQLIEPKSGNSFGNEFAIDVDRFGASQSTNMDKAERQKFPRTLKELNNMTTAAKEAEWGNEADGHDDSSDSSVEDIFLDGDSSVGSSDSEDFLFVRAPLSAPLSPDNSSTGGNTATSSSQVAGSVIGSRASSGRKPRESNSRVGPSSELLTPVVRVTNEYDDVVLNGQSPELAEAWILGDCSAEKKAEYESVPPSENGDDPAALSWIRGSHHSESSHRTFTSQGSYSGSPIAQVKSDTALGRVDPEAKNRDSATAALNSQDDKTMHGGVNQSDVRPNRKESMVFLRKLFTYQRGGGGVYPALVSSFPDSAMLPKSLSPSSVKRSASSNAILQTLGAEAPVVKTKKAKEASVDVPSRKFGVYFEPISYPQKGALDDNRSLLRTMDVCLQNASTSHRLGQPDKAHVWSLVAQIVDNILEDDIDAFNGWSGSGALGQQFISNILRHYEVQGDVQMLASIVCVLGRESSLLQPMQEEKYDNYIRRYAELLFGWRLLTARAEVNKHLACRSSGKESEEKMDEMENDRSFVPLCSRCGGEAQPDKNICSHCGDYAFRCSICTNAVKGLFTFCILCGHGGHIEHIVPWFETHVACPSGCGCECLFDTLPPEAERQSLIPASGDVVVDPTSSIETI